MDIVEQCRKAKEYNLFDADVYEQAANEIERLRGKIKKLERELDKKDANADMQYLNGMKFGWNCGLYEDNETYETVKKSILLQIRYWKQHWRKSDGYC
jgi:hypothetical protein